MKKVNLFAICVMACLLVGCEPKVTEQKPTVLTLDVTEVTTHSAQVSCNVVSDGGSPVIDRGVAYDIYPNPKATGTKCKAGTGTGKYTCSLTDLQDNKRYYVRAYARNDIGIEYGKEMSFMTIKELLPPSIITSDITDISGTSAIVEGNVTNDGGVNITEFGIVYGTSQNPTINDNNKVIGEGKMDAFACTLTNLQENTAYYARAYAINEIGVGYGEDKSFTTKEIILPTVITSEVTDISFTSATIGGNVTNDGNASITEYGIVYGASQNPTISNNKIQCGSGIGSFTCNITDLQDNLIYYARAYAINSKGIAYGEEKSFRTQEMTLPTVSTAEVTDISYTTATIGGNVIDGGNTRVTDAGIAYSTSQNPTISDNKFNCSIGTGPFNGVLSKLQDNTTYYVRAYAINSKGVSYGEQVSFTTKEILLENGHQCVDLGLSVKWATCNIDATAPEKKGGYYAWGKRYKPWNYDWTDYDKGFDNLTYNGTCDCCSGTYAVNPCCGDYIGHVTELKPEDDIASINWGGNWRMPTKEEAEELINNCIWTYTKQKNVNGYLVTSKYNGNTIFLPLTGFTTRHDEVTYEDQGLYWTSSLDTSNEDNLTAYILMCDYNYSEDHPIVLVDDKARCFGLQVRPVCP